MTRDKTPHITISDRDGLPYSKGLMASQVMVTGLSVYRSYEVAETIDLRGEQIDRHPAPLGKLVADIVEIRHRERMAVAPPPVRDDAARQHDQVGVGERVPGEDPDRYRLVYEFTTAGGDIVRGSGTVGRAAFDRFADQCRAEHVGILRRDFTWRIEPGDGGCRVTIEHDFRPRIRPWARFIDRFFTQPVAGRTLASFKAIAEAVHG